MKFTLRLWPSYVRFAASVYRGWSQGGFYDFPAKKERRNVNKSFVVTFGFVWPVKETYRDKSQLDYDATYLILGDDQ